MSYLHIENLYKNQTIFLFKECFALEKIHGTSAHLSWKDGRDGITGAQTGGVLHFSSGGSKHETFKKIFDEAALRAGFQAMGHPSVTVYGEAYGGSQQGQKRRYGDKLRFVAFEVRIGEHWLAVPQAEDVVKKLGLEFVHYAIVPTTIDALNAERDAPSEQARRNGVEGDQPREGVVLRPLIELRGNDGERIISKHKRDEERETASPRSVEVDPARLAVLTKATEIADEWVTPTRLEHVLDKLEAGGKKLGMEQMKDIIAAMVEDILREGAGEVVDSKEARTAIGKKTAVFMKRLLEARLAVIGARPAPETESETAK